MFIWQLRWGIILKAISVFVPANKVRRGHRNGERLSVRPSLRPSQVSHEKKIVTVGSRWAHGDHGGHGSRPNDHGSVTARRGHSSVTARSQLSHGEVTAQSQHLQYDHGSVVAGCDHFGHRELTVSSHGGQFFFHGLWPLPGKIITPLISNLVYAFGGWVFRTDSLLGNVGPILAL